MVQKIGNSAFTQSLNDAYSSLRDAVKNHPKTALAAGTALAGAAAYAINPNLFALTKTDYGWVRNETWPTLLGRAVNLISGKSNEPTYDLTTFYICSSISGAATLYGLASSFTGIAAVPSALVGGLIGAISIGIVYVAKSL